MNNYEARWRYAKNLALAIKAKCREIGEGYLLTYGDTFINAEQLQIRENSIVVIIDNCAFGVFTNNPAWDEGSHDTIKEINQMFKREFKIMKEITW